MFGSLVQKHRATLARQGLGQNGGDAGKVIATMPAARTGLAGANQTAALIDVSLSEDLASLKSMQSIERKVEFKRGTLVPRYRDQIKSLMQSGKKHVAISYYMIWCFDAEFIGEGIELAAWCIEHHQPMPEGFKSSVAFFAASQVLEWANLQFKKGHNLEPYIGDMFAIISKDEIDIDDATRSGFYRLYGLEAAEREDWAAAVEQLEKALSLGAKVSTALDKSKKKLDSLTAPEGDK